MSKLLQILMKKGASYSLSMCGAIIAWMSIGLAMTCSPVLATPVAKMVCQKLYTCLPPNTVDESSLFFPSGRAARFSMKFSITCYRPLIGRSVCSAICLILLAPCFRFSSVVLPRTVRSVSVSSSSRFRLVSVFDSC